MPHLRYNQNQVSLLEFLSLAAFPIKYSFLLAESDVMVFSPLRGAAGDIYLRILKGRPRLYIHVSLILYVYLVLLRSYSTLFIWLGFHHLSFWGSFLGNITL